MNARPMLSRVSISASGPGPADGICSKNWSGYGPTVRMSKLRGGVACALLEQPQGDARGNAVEPGAQRRAWLKPVDAAPSAQQRLLQRIVGVVWRTEHPVAVDVQRRPMGQGEPDKRVLLARAGGRQQCRLVTTSGCVYPNS